MPISSPDLFDLSHCILCPRECGVNRTAGRYGFCSESAGMRAARAALLYYEEPCISGTRGSGAVFFTGCSLGCVFCQNAGIAGGLREGPAAAITAITEDRLSDIFLELEQQGAANINLVTASHFLPLIVPALESALRRGLSIPVVYNTSAYEKPAAIRRLDGLVDIYLPDLKFRSPALGSRWASAPDYWDRATAVLEEMVRQCPVPLFADGTSSLEEENDADIPLMKRGVIVRHLVMPGQAEDAKAVLRYLHETYGNQIFVSIMNQYTPMPQCAADPVLSRPTEQKEYDAVIDYAILLGIENGFIQEGETISRSFIPAWDGTGVNSPSRPDT